MAPYSIGRTSYQSSESGCMFSKMKTTIGPSTTSSQAIPSYRVFQDAEMSHSWTDPFPGATSRGNAYGRYANVPRHTWRMWLAVIHDRHRRRQRRRSKCPIYDFDSPPAMLKDIMSGDADVGKQFRHGESKPCPRSSAMSIFEDEVDARAPCCVIRTGISLRSYSKMESSSELNMNIVSVYPFI